MNIGIVTTWFERGGAYVSRQYRDSLSHGHNVFIYARGGESYAEGDPEWDCPSVTWGRKLGVSVPTFIELCDFRTWIEKNGLDIVFFNEQQWWEPVLLCNSLGVTTGAYVDYYTEETIPLFDCYDFLICNTNRHFGVFNWHPQVFYIPWGTDISLFTFNGSAPVNPGEITFFHSAGVSPERKGTDLLIQAFERVHGHARLVLHTQVDIGEHFPKLKRLLEGLAANDRLTIIQKTIAAPGVYRLGDVYVYPSRLDGIGLTIVEALSSGLPVITGDAAPMNEFVQGDSGKLVSIESWHARSDGYYWPCCAVSLNDLTEQMQFFVDRYDELPCYKLAARDRAEKYLNWSKNAVNLSSLFASVRRRSSEEKDTAGHQVRVFEAKRLTLDMKLYRRFPRQYRWIASLLQRKSLLFKS